MDESKTPISMVLVPSKSRMGNLIAHGFDQLESEGFGKIVRIDVLISAHKKNGNHGRLRLLVVDEDRGRAVFNYLQKNGITPQHTLVLSDLGIEDDEEDLQLLKDGIVAECVLVGDQVPGAHCSCCSS